MANQSTSSASFYDSPFKYKEENTALLYQNIRMILQDILKGINDVDTNMKNIEGAIMNTAKLLNAIEVKSMPDET
ncbi:hypothetical protein WN48_05329 [Eufriesea mexicana]|uniref:Uncharacterized protein n=1 Tax=Eufriesea mexicana TaxID=516756 RepID=A0A310SLA7_9HYME|nr:hypothetical protein WN48_05329 [Eufriesea mexicana]